MSTPSPFLAELVQRYPALVPCAAALDAAAWRLTTTLREGHWLLVCGNGGSAADAEHIVGELLKKFVHPRPLPSALSATLRREFGAAGEYLASHLEQGLRAIALTGHPALATAMANDVAADLVFAQQVLAWGGPGDCLLAISTSGNAANVGHALRVARAKGMSTIGLTGATGGAMLPLCDTAIRVPETHTHRVQELHLPIYHALCLHLEHELCGQP